MNLDTATLQINSTLSVATVLFGQVDECEKCPLMPMTQEVIPGIQTNLTIGTVYNTLFAVRNGVQDLCKFQAHFYEYGVYNLEISENIGSNENNAVNCSINRIDPYDYHDANTPVYVAIGLVFPLIILYQVMKLLIEKYCGTKKSDAENIEMTKMSSNNEPVAFVKKRIQSLDAFRGLTLVLMIFIVSSGGGYWYFIAKSWNGISLADWLFPCFVFIMGISIGISMRSAAKQENISKWKMFLNILRRSIILFGLGVVVNSKSSPNWEGIAWSELRLPSVLGRFSIGYLVVATSQLIFLNRLKPTRTVRWPILQDILPFWPIWLISLTFPTAHLLITYLLPVPGCPTGYHGPGGLHDNASYFNCTGGAAGYIDRVWLGEKHLYSSSTAQEIYKSLPFDPEGVLGYLTSIFLVFLGLQAGRIITIYQGHKDRLARLVIWSIFLGVIAGALCGFTKNDGWNPINKNLWSVSFVLATAATAMLVFAIFYTIIDVWKIWNGFPFNYPSMNSIVIYVASEVLYNTLPFRWDMPLNHAAQLFMSVWPCVLWVIIAYWFYRRNLFIVL